MTAVAQCGPDNTTTGAPIPTSSARSGGGTTLDNPRGTSSPASSPAQTTPPTKATTAAPSPVASGTAPATGPVTPTTTVTPTATSTRGPDRADRSATRVAAEGEKVLFFTFDDGPSEYTPAVLDTLAKHNAHATFFLVGEQMRAHPELVQRIRAEGHTIGNHTLAHKSLPYLSSDEVRAALQGGPVSRCMRPPYGAINSRVREIAEEEMNFEVVLWGVDPRDWERPGAEKIEKRILKNVWPGAIILLHDGGGKRDQTVAALDPLLTKLAERGYRFLALDC